MGELTQQDYARLRSIGQFDALEAQYFALEAKLEEVERERAYGVVIHNGQALRIEHLEQQLAAAREQIARLEGELHDKDTVPRSRYDACNKDWLEAEQKVREVGGAAIKEIGNITAERDRLAGGRAGQGRVMGNAQTEICNEILDIMEEYHEQEARPECLGSPGGLEHMGDVWKLFHKWEHALTPAAAQEEEHE